jgi:hypothetical protein
MTAAEGADTGDTTGRVRAAWPGPPVGPLAEARQPAQAQRRRLLPNGVSVWTNTNQEVPFTLLLSGASYEHRS